MRPCISWITFASLAGQVEAHDRQTNAFHRALLVDFPGIFVE